MSIYGSTFSAGDPDNRDEDPAVVLIRDNGENHWPSLGRNRRGSIDGAWIPGWCVPGHDSDADLPGHDSDANLFGYEKPGGWYRLSGCSVRTAPEFPNTPAQLWRDQEYLLDEVAARLLRDDLTAWLALPKTRPVTG